MHNGHLGDRDATTSESRAILERLQGEVELLKLSISTFGHPSPMMAKNTEAPKNKGDSSLVTFLEMIRRIRSIRNNIFNSNEIFAEPAWDIIIDLMLNDAAGKPVSITSACIASNSPPTTALRWLTVLESNGLIARTSDHKDGRRQFVSVTDNCRNLMKIMHLDFIKLSEICP